MLSFRLITVVCVINVLYNIVNELSVDELSMDDWHVDESSMD